MTQHKEAPSKSDAYSLRELLFKYLKKWPWFVISIIFCIGSAWLFLQSTDIKYTVNASILLRDGQSNGMMDSQTAIFESLGFASMGKRDVDDEIQILRSSEILRNVVYALQLNTEYYQKKRLRYVDLYPNHPLNLLIAPEITDTLRRPIVLKVRQNSEGFRVNFRYGDIKERYQIKNLNSTFQTPIGALSFQQLDSVDEDDRFMIRHYPTQFVIEELSENIKVLEVNKRSNAIKMVTDAANTKKAVDILNKIIEFYNLDAIVDKNLFAKNTSTFISERLALIQGELFQAELDVANFKEKHKLTDISSEVRILLESNTRFRRDIEHIENQLRILGFVEEQLQKRDEASTIPLNIGLESGSLNALIPHYNENILLKLKLERTATPNNPTLELTKVRLEEYRKNILSTIQSVKQNLNITLSSLQNLDTDYLAKIQDIPTFERQFHELQRQQHLKHNLYMFLMQKQEENAMTLASTVPTAKILNQPTASILPSSPKTVVILAVALLFGFAFPFFTLHLRDLISNTITDKKELLKLVKAPYLGSIMRVNNKEKVHVKEGVTTPIVELFRLVRTNLQFMFGGKKSPVILVTSSIDSEGKSFTAINLSMSFALMKKKVVLVGLDLRKPMLGEYLHVAKNKGVSMYLSDQSLTVNDVLLSSGIHPSLYVIPAGPIPPNPGELIMSERLEELFAQLKTEFDYIIVDSAPIGKVSDTYLLNRIVDNTVYVTRIDFTPREVVDLINEIHEHKKLNNMGVILNDVDKSSSSGYGYKYGYN